MSLHVLGEVEVGVVCPLEVFHEGGVLRHLPDVLPVLVQRESHHVEDTVQLIMVVGVTGLITIRPLVILTQF